MTIGELAERTGMTVRNIRAHQTRGILPPPVVHGRTGYYNEEHVARIELTRELQGEGLNLEAIRRMGEGVNGAAEEIHNLTRSLRAPFEEEAPEIVELTELIELWKTEVEEGRGPEMMQRGEKLGVIRALPDGKVEVISPRMMKAAAALAEVGMSPTPSSPPPRNCAARPTTSPSSSPTSSSNRSGSPSTRPVAPRATGPRSVRPWSAPARSAPTSSWASSRSRWPRRPTKRSVARSAASPAAPARKLAAFPPPLPVGEPNSYGNLGGTWPSVNANFSLTGWNAPVLIPPSFMYASVQSCETTEQQGHNRASRKPLREAAGRGAHGTRRELRDSPREGIVRGIDSGPGRQLGSFVVEPSRSVVSGDANGSGARRSAAPFVLCLSIVAMLALCASPALAAQTHPYTGTSFGPDGVGGTESFERVQSIAVDSANGDTYVYDGGAGKVYKFDSAGAPVDFSATGTNAISGVGGGGGGAEFEIALAPAGSPAGTAGDIYVANNGGAVHVYSAAGAELGEIPQGGETCGVATDPAATSTRDLLQHD